MSYDNCDELPHTVRAALDPVGQDLWMRAYNEAEGSPWERSQAAWDAVKDLDGCRYFEGWASVEKVDVQNDMVDIDGLSHAVEKFIERGAPLIDGHTNRTVGAYIGYEVREHDPGVRGLVVKGVVFQGERLYDRVWADLKQGNITGLSIGGDALKQVMECDTSTCWNCIKELHLFEISAVGNPANKDARIILVNEKAKGENMTDDKAPVDKGIMLPMEKLHDYMSKHPGAQAEDIIKVCKPCAEAHAEMAKAAGKEAADRAIMQVVAKGWEGARCAVSGCNKPATYIEEDLPGNWIPLCQEHGDDAADAGSKVIPLKMPSFGKDTTKATVICPECGSDRINYRYDGPFKGYQCYCRECGAHFILDPDGTIKGDVNGNGTDRPCAKSVLDPVEYATQCPNCHAPGVKPYNIGNWSGADYFCDRCRTYFNIDPQGRMTIGETLKGDTTKADDDIWMNAARDAYDAYEKSDEARKLMLSWSLTMRTRDRPDLYDAFARAEAQLVRATNACKSAYETARFKSKAVEKGAMDDAEDMAEFYRQVGYIEGDLDHAVQDMDRLIQEYGGGEPIRVLKQVRDIVDKQQKALFRLGRGRTKSVEKIDSPSSYLASAMDSIKAARDAARRSNMAVLPMIQKVYIECNDALIAAKDEERTMSKGTVADAMNVTRKLDPREVMLNDRLKCTECGLRFYGEKAEVDPNGDLIICPKCGSHKVVNAGSSRDGIVGKADAAEGKPAPTEAPKPEDVKPEVDSKDLEGVMQKLMAMMTDLHRKLMAPSPQEAPVNTEQAPPAPQQEEKPAKANIEAQDAPKGEDGQSPAEAPNVPDNGISSDDNGNAPAKEKPPVPEEDEKKKAVAKGPSRFKDLTEEQLQARISAILREQEGTDQMTDAVFYDLDDLNDALIILRNRKRKSEAEIRARIHALEKQAMVNGRMSPKDAEEHRVLKNELNAMIIRRN